MSACKQIGCRAPIIFAVNDKTGRRVPLDAVPDDLGRFAVQGRRHELTTRGTQELVHYGVSLGQDEEPPAGAVLHMAHQANCQDPPGGRKRRREKASRPPTLFDPYPEGTPS